MIASFSCSWVAFGFLAKLGHLFLFPSSLSMMHEVTVGPCARASSLAYAHISENAFYHNQQRAYTCRALRSFKQSMGKKKDANLQW
eukprot:1793585-Pleurochrysis_carterae.AAC.2